MNKSEYKYTKRDQIFKIVFNTYISGIMDDILTDSHDKDLL